MYTIQFYMEHIACHYKRVFKKIRYMTNLNVAEDITQIVMEKAWKNINQLKDPNKAKTWLYTIAVNEVKQYYKVKSNAIECMVDYDLSSADSDNLIYEDVLQIVLRSENERMLIEFIDGLDYKYQTTIKLRFYADLSFSEIADTLDLNVNTTRVLLHRGLKQLRKQYEEYNEPN